MISASTAPLLLLDGNDCIVLAASDSFYRAFQIDPADVVDRALGTVGDGEWAVSQLDALLRATASGHAEVAGYEMELQRHGREPRHLVIDARRLNHDGIATPRLLLSIANVTDALLAEKIKDDLLREQTILLQELQHRVANSLQIIASVLIQSARRIDSAEVRSHLHDAHHRVMSVATLQQQLAISTMGQVELRSYLTDLCRSIGASMIHDPDQLSIEVLGDPGKVDADVSVSLGLIVTDWSSMR